MSIGTLHKWGNSQGITIPKSVCEQLGIKAGDKLKLFVDGHRIMMEPERECTLNALMEGYDGPPPEEYDWGKPMGKEMW